MGIYTKISSNAGKGKSGKMYNRLRVCICFFGAFEICSFVVSSSELFISDVAAEQAQRIWRQMDRSCCLFSVSLFEKNRESCFFRTKKRDERNIFSLFSGRTFFDFMYSFFAGSRGKLFVVYRLLLFFFGNNGDLYCYCVRNSAFSFVEHIQLGDGTI